MHDGEAHSLPDLLRARLAEGRPAQGIIDGWEWLERSIASEPTLLTEALIEASRFAPEQGAAAVAPPSALGRAVIDPKGLVIEADPVFSAWFGSAPDETTFRRLIEAAARAGQAFGLVETADGSVIAACAGLRSAATSWPLSDGARRALEASAARVALLCFAPSRVGELARRATEAFGFTPLEARLAEALLDAPNLGAAAERIGVGRETAREALKKALRKAGARRSPDLVRRLMDLMCGDHPPPRRLEAVLAASFGATAAEARAAARFASGLTAREVAHDLGLSETTVRGQLKAVFAKAGVGKTKDLVRLASETGALAALTDAAETVLEPADRIGRLRVVADGDRRIGLTDYGPRSGRPVVVMHGAGTGRRLPAPLVTALQARGFRPITPQRPGYGLTDVARGDYLGQAADDMARVLDALHIDRVRLVVRDSGTPSGLRFAAERSDRVEAGLAVNPKLPSARHAPAIRIPASLMGTVARAFITSPHIIELVAETLRRQTRTELLADVMRQALAAPPCDSATLEQPGVLETLVRDAQGMFARTSAGFAAEHRAYSEGWAPPEVVGGAGWIVVEGEAVALAGNREAWNGLPNVRYRLIPDAGLLIYFQAPDLIADLVAEA
ncbi:alpha/beta fold hydrolase [Caulobacter mirabilis]|uniref:HTH luxR-type domain-containing protein n=1 Tax=Caulobacter mirabilis TaxID=69666 RepID=A0A2D2AWA7_9CAUL|nr:alpha/beta fold hydrolase [Caulobacter mirabilis]ATQ42294.1 hypothetical protein CSW64_07610 [Caulobacter mirabilis]